MIVCIQCAMEEFIKGSDMELAARLATFEETINEHMNRCHPDSERTYHRRKILEVLCAQRLLGKTIMDPTKN